MERLKTIIGIALAAGITVSPSVAIAGESTGSTELLITRVDDKADVDMADDQIRMRVSVLDGTILDDHVEPGEYDHLAGMTDPTAEGMSPIEAVGDFVSGVLSGIKDFASSLAMSTGR